MNSNIKIDLLRFQSDVKVRLNKGFRQIFDPLRKKWLIFTPEEMVRQLLIVYFIQELNIPYSRISLEKEFKINGLSRRYDAVIHSPNLDPICLVECKASYVKIQQSTFDQIFEYNWTLKVPYLIVSNGVENYCLRKNADDLSSKPSFMHSMPDYNELCGISDEQ